MDAQALAQAGLDALRIGDAVGARARFQEIADAGGAPPWLLFARACNMLGDAAGEEQALQGQLDADGTSLPALFAMGDLKIRQGDDRGASAFFRLALRHVSAMPAPPAELRSLAGRAAAFLDQATRRYEAHLTGQLAEAGLTSPSPRMRHALDLLLGKAQLYQQQPNMFYYPGLPQRQFYERAEFGWIAGIEAMVPALQDELAGILADEAEFDPYIAPIPGRPAPPNPLLNDPSWGAYYFWQAGAPVEAHAARAPQTMAALALAPIPVIRGRSPMALYSLLKPGTHIQPHSGMLNTRLICHIPLIAPEGCALRVGSETRGWREGEALIFDDSFEHEAWNRSDRTRIILLFEIWRPEIGAAEREELTLLFEAIDLLPAGDGPDA
jgi:aspartyl/asparaginyl beta-hydroxylase (cupin superfamily)